VRQEKIIVIAAETLLTEARTDPILKRYRAALDEIYGAQIERVVLFGSRARGDSRPDSDYDIAVFLKSLPDRWEVFHRLAKLQFAFIDETSTVFDTKPFAAEAYIERTPLMHDIRKDGLDL
jgi:predicted nucleotidyltransferase